MLSDSFSCGCLGLPSWEWGVCVWGGGRGEEGAYVPDEEGHMWGCLYGWVCG